MNWSGNNIQKINIFLQLLYCFVLKFNDLTNFWYFCINVKRAGRKMVWGDMRSSFDIEFWHAQHHESVTAPNPNIILSDVRYVCYCMFTPILNTYPDIRHFWHLISTRLLYYYTRTSSWGMDFFDNAIFYIVLQLVGIWDKK